MTNEACVRHRRRRRVVAGAMPPPLLLLAGAMSAAVATAVDQPPTDLQLEFMTSPLRGLDFAGPHHFSWQAAACTSAGSGSDSSRRLAPLAAQAASQIRVQQTLPGGAIATTLYDSGWVSNVRPEFVAPILPLQTDRSYSWSVRTRSSASGALTPWSSSFNFTTGIFKQAEWKARWIRGGTQMRRAFTVPPGVVARATVFVSACQYYALTLDGQRVGRNQLDVGWTSFKTNRSYTTYDIDPSLVSAGSHVLGIRVGQGFCTKGSPVTDPHVGDDYDPHAERSALLQLQLHDAHDRVTFTLVTDSSWSVSDGPVLKDSTYFGEIYDARREQAGWDTPSFQPLPDRPWKPASLVLGNDDVTMRAAMLPPITAVHTMPALNVTIVPRAGIVTAEATAAPVRYVYDFGQEFSGVVRLSLPAGIKRGVNITIKHTEALSHSPIGPDDGSAFTGNLYWAHPIDYYMTKGGGNELYQPEFTYHGFRYVELEFDGDHPAPTLQTVTGVNLRSSVVEAATMHFGSDGSSLVERISSNSWWTEAAALMSIPAGAAARGERNGWTGDAAMAAESELFDFDTAAFFSRYIEQVLDSQCPDGELGNGVPPAGSNTSLHECGGPNSVERVKDPNWGQVLVQILYYHWKANNATTTVDRAWNGVERYMDFINRNFSVSRSTGSEWGDWQAAVETPRIVCDKREGIPQRNVSHCPTDSQPGLRTITHITAAAAVVMNHMQVAEMAAATGRHTQARKYSQRVTEMKQQYHESFYDPAAQIYGDGTSTAFACALWLGVTPPPLLDAVVENFVQHLESLRYRVVGIGFIGVRYVFEALAKNNRTDVALKMLQATEYPSYGYNILGVEHATSLWESWDGSTMQQWFDESSRDHHFTASINTFIRKYLGGLDQVYGATGWEVVRCRPEAAHHSELLDSASVHLASRRGNISCSWRAKLPTPPLPPPPPPPPAAKLPVYCRASPQFPVPGGGLASESAPLNLSCPVGEKIIGVVYSKWGAPDLGSPLAPGALPVRGHAWFCYGAQPPPAGKCEADTSQVVEKLCVGRHFCDLGTAANVELMGDPCHLGKRADMPLAAGGYMLIVRIRCSTTAESEHSTPPVVTSVGELAPEPDEQWAHVNVTVPAGSTGEIHVPIRTPYNSPSARTIYESGVPVWHNGVFLSGRVAGVRKAEVLAEGKFVVFETLSGKYRFASSA